MIKLSYEQQIAFNSLSIIVGNALYALTVVLFLVPSGLITGGATGIALGINRALGLPVSGVLFVINMTMLTVGWVLLGRRFAITTIASTVLSPLFLALWERVFTGFVLTDDLVLNTIFAGLGVGISLGITIRAGASTGGMDIPPLVLNKYFHIPVSASMLVFDMLILCLQAAFSPLQQCLYGIVMVIVYTVVLDKVLLFGTTRTEVKIISQHADDIRETIIGDILDMDQTTAPYFMEIGMHCLGCPASRGESIEEACAVHGVDCDELIEKLNEHLAAKKA